MTGDVRRELFHGSVVTAGVRSPFALYDESLATYGNADTFDHAAADGFIRLYGLPFDQLAETEPFEAR